MIDKIKRYQLQQVEHNFHITEDINSINTNDCKKYDFIIIDSVNSLNIKPEAFGAIIKKTKQHNTSLIAIFQATKKGTYKGATQYEHDVDISLNANNGIAENRKNRFAGKGLWNIFHNKLQTTDKQKN